MSDDREEMARSYLTVRDALRDAGRGDLEPVLGILLQRHYETGQDNVACMVMQAAIAAGSGETTDSEALRDTAMQCCRIIELNLGPAYVEFFRAGDDDA